MEKFKDKYRVPSARLSSWNYAWAGAYFVTLCTKNNECYFGVIENEKMHLNTLGQRAAQCWNAIPEHFPFVTLGAWVIMPNHVHGIIIINPVETQNLASSPCLQNLAGKTETQDIADKTETQDIAGKTETQDIAGKTETQDIAGKTETQDIASLRVTQNTFGPQSGNLASVIRGFKIGVTKGAKESSENFSWQPRFHDHIIRNNESLNRIAEYIENNPKNWAHDELHDLRR